MRHLARLLPATCVALAAAFGGAGGALALDTCRGGEFSGSPLRQLPQPAVVGVDLTDNSPENAGLAAAFTDGMSSAGAQVSGSQAATVKMRLSWQVLNPGGGGGDSGSSAGVAQPFLQGGPQREAPSIPNNGVITGRQTTQPGLLVFRAEARDPSGATVFWIGLLQCTLQGGENEKLLFELGQLIGGAIGQRRERVAM
jgi:hypothetical protein